MSYTPRVDDYVIWHTQPNNISGWVYFRCDDYISIEIRVKDKCEQNIKDCPIHKKTHVLVVCYTQFWNELEYVKNRRDEEDSYKAQEYRYADVQ